MLDNYLVARNFCGKQTEIMDHATLRINSSIAFTPKKRGRLSPTKSSCTAPLFTSPTQKEQRATADSFRNLLQMTRENVTRQRLFLFLSHYRAFLEKSSEESKTSFEDDSKWQHLNPLN